MIKNNNLLDVNGEIPVVQKVEHLAGGITMTRKTPDQVTIEEIQHVVDPVSWLDDDKDVTFKVYRNKKNKIIMVQEDVYPVTPKRLRVAANE